MQHPRTISSSYSAELHRKLMLENNVVTCMPKIAYQTHFQNDGIAALPLSSNATITHALLYHEDPDSDTYELATRFIRTLKKYFEKHYGVYKET